MDELEIMIHQIECDMQDVANKVDSYSMHGRQPSHDERLSQLRLLETYSNLNQKLSVCKEVLETCINNKS